MTCSTRSTRPSTLNLSGAGQRDHRRRLRARARSPTTTRCRRCRSTTSPSARSTPARSTRPSPSRSRPPSGRPVTVDYATADDSGDRAGRLRGHQRHPELRARPDRSSTVTVPVNGDLLDEANETYFLEPRRARSTRRSRTPRASARSTTTTRCRRSPSTTSRSPRATPAPSTRASRSASTPPSGRSVTVDYATANGSATAPARTTPPQRARWSSPPARRRRRSPSPSTATCSTRATRPSRSTSRIR